MYTDTVLRRTVDNGLTLGECGLGEALPPIPITGSQADIAMYSTFVQGRTGGGGWEQFQDLVGLGWVPNTQDGFALYITYAQQGLAKIRNALPEFFGWALAAQYAYAITRRMHTGNNLSPFYDVPFALQQAKNALAGALSASFGAFDQHFPRLLTKWGYTGPAPMSVQDPSITQPGAVAATPRTAAQIAAQDAATRARIEANRLRAATQAAQFSHLQAPSPTIRVVTGGVIRTIPNPNAPTSGPETFPNLPTGPTNNPIINNIDPHHPIIVGYNPNIPGGGPPIFGPTISPMPPSVTVPDAGEDVPPTPLPVPVQAGMSPLLIGGLVVGLLLLSKKKRSR